MILGKKMIKNSLSFLNNELQEKEINKRKS